MAQKTFDLKVDQNANGFFTVEAWEGETLIARREVQLENLSGRFSAVQALTATLREFEIKVGHWLLNSVS